MFLFLQISVTFEQHIKKDLKLKITIEKHITNKKLIKYGNKVRKKSGDNVQMII
jgi:hypothetical protein